MSQSKKKSNPKNPYPFLPMSQPILRGYVIAITVLLPLLVDETKYSAITKFKLSMFILFFGAAAVLLLLAFVLYETTKVTPERVFKQNDIIGPTIFADIALAGYWLFMLVSSFSAIDRSMAFNGMTPRNNGFWVQSMYIATYFVLAHGLLPKLKDALVFVWGGALFGAACILHFFGIDLYRIGSVNGPEYAGPFWPTTKYRFMGPMGNVNLGSYVLAITAIIAAGLFIQKVAPEWDERNILTAVCYGVILFAELNINTDAGLVAVAAAAILIPPVLCTDLDRLRRTVQIYAISAGVLLLKELVVEVGLRDGGFGMKCKVLLLGTAVLALAAVLLTYFRSWLEGTFLARTKKSVYRAVCAGVMLLAAAAGIGASLYITRPDPTPVGSIAGAVEIIDKYEYKEKTDSVLHELGQILRGNLDDDFGHNRLFTWKRSLRLVELNPLFGIGPDNFKTVFAAFFKSEALEQFPDSSGGVDKAHNEFIDVLVDNGILGLLTYLAFYGFLLYHAFRRADEKTFAPVFGIAIIGYMAHAFFGYQLPIQSPCMWVMIGVGAAFIRSEEKKLAE